VKLSQREWLSDTPGGEWQQLVVGDVKDPQILVSDQKSAAVFVQVVSCQVELLECTEAFLWLAAGRNAFQGVGWHI